MEKKRRFTNRRRLRLRRKKHDIFKLGGKRKAEQEVAASHEHPDEDEFNWDSEEDKVFKEDPKVVPSYQKKKQSCIQRKGRGGQAGKKWRRRLPLRPS